MTEAQETTYAPGRGPGAVALSDDALAQLLGAHQMGIWRRTSAVVILSFSTVAYVWDASERTARISTTADRLKVRQLQRDPRAALYVSSRDFMSYVVAEGEAELSAVSTASGDAAGRELLGIGRPSTVRRTRLRSSRTWSRIGAW